MQDVKELLQQKIKEIVHELGAEVDEVIVESPKDQSHGDLSTNVAMVLAKQLKKNPIEIAQEIIERLFEEIPSAELTQLSKGQNLKEKYITVGETRVSLDFVRPGFINFYLSEEYFKSLPETIIKEREFYGKSDWGKGKTWLIEHTSANPNKAMHLGHLRNNLTGMAVSNLWEFVGIHVIRDYIDNDRGIAIAKLMWGYLKFAKKDGEINTDIKYWYDHQNEWLTPEDSNKRPDRFVDELYVKASDDFKNNPEVEDIVRRMVVDWEAEDKIAWALWERVLKYSHEGQELTMKRLGSKLDKIWHEHDHYKKGKDYVEEGLKKGIFQKVEGGAILSNLKDYKLSDTIIIKRDGTALYITQDLALTKLKVETFHPDKLFWVVGPEQSLALQQFFAICEQLGIGKRENFVHLTFGFMSIKGSGRMGSRLGNVVYIDELLDDAANLIKEKIVKEELSQKEKDEIAEKVGIAAVKYSILKVGRTTATAFDFDTSLSFEGDSGPYLEYTYARAKSIVRQGEDLVNKEFDVKNAYSSEFEINLLKHLSKFQEIVLKAAQTYSPNFICEYLYQLSQTFNQFYTNCPVLNAENANDKIARIKLVQATAQVLKNGLNLLGIETVERM